jgi:hypothetical protein
MENSLLATFIFVLLISGVWLYRDLYLCYRANSAVVQKLKMVGPLIRKLASKEIISDDEILTLAKDPALRCGIFRVLDAYGQNQLFPGKYLTQEKAAESFLVSWLEYPTELGKAPDEIELMEKITLQENEELVYYVFKFRTIMPHWAARSNWMIGVVGPYQPKTPPFQEPLRVYSRFNQLQRVSPESEAKWVHENIA